MSRNGSGTYTLPAGNPVTTGTTISSTVHNNTLSDIETALTQSLAKDGQTTPTANLPMGGFKHTGLAAGSTAGDSLRYEQLFTTGTLGLLGPVTVTADAFGALQLVPLRDIAGYLNGYTLSNNVTDATNDIDIATGVAVSSDSVYLIRLASALTKRLDANWTVGTNQGMLDTGSIANTTYHIFAIARSDTGVVDVLASTSPTAPTMPANYDYKRRIGSIVRTGAAIKPFLQTGNQFDWKTPVLDVNAAANTAATNRTLTVPTGIKVKACITATAASAGTAGNTIVNDPDVGALTGSSTNRSILNADGVSVSASLDVMTNTSAQVNTDGDGTSATITISTFGYIDDRRI
jgi:hypothetical protein